jgi:predicted anti-sigma-YlaC factor YlaD
MTWVCSPRCTRVREALSALLDGEGDGTDAASAVVHLHRCAGCRRFLVGVVLTTRALRALRVIEPSSAGQRR